MLAREAPAELGLALRGTERGAWPAIWAAYRAFCARPVADVEPAEDGDLLLFEVEPSGPGRLELAAGRQLFPPGPDGGQGDMVHAGFAISLSVEIGAAVGEPGARWGRGDAPREFFLRVEETEAHRAALAGRVLELTLR